MSWTSPIYSRRDVNLAGAQLIKVNTWLDYQQALGIINNWRSSHSFPLNAFSTTLRGRAKQIDPHAIIAQRLKRLSSISAKLLRFPDMRLSQMQDIGGCRAVVKNVKDVGKLVALYKKSVAKNPSKRHDFVHEKDYIATPKCDGYRSVHLIYRYRSRAKKHAVYNGLKIELQLRSRLQHAWATAVETASTFTGQHLKSNIGDECWKRFFALMGSELAARERTALVPGTPTDREELLTELRGLVDKLQVSTVLMGWGQAVGIVTEKAKEAHSFLLVLDANAKTIKIIGFSRDELAKASAEYLKAEEENSSKSWMQTVLVTVDSVALLRSAYPNYYLDTSAFLDAVDQACASTK